MNHACAYCGVANADTEDHVIPNSLYPPSKSNSKIRRLKVPACRTCNHSWSDDEPHFRTILTLAGEPNQAVRELWKGKVNRSLRDVDGRRRFSDVWAQMRPVDIPEGERHEIYPASDDRFLKIMRKIVRGLHYHHELWSPVPDEMVYVDVLRFVIPKEVVDAMKIYNRELDIFQYQFEVFDDFEDIPMSSAWLLTFFENRRFIALVWKTISFSQPSPPETNRFSEPPDPTQLEQSNP